MRLPTSTLNITLAALVVIVTACGQLSSSNATSPRISGTQNGGAAGSTADHTQGHPNTSTQGQPSTGNSGIPQTGSGTPTNPPIATQPISPPQIDCYKGDAFICKIERLIADKTNKYRASRGLQPLTFDGKFAFVARDWSLKQAKSGGISHRGFPNSREAVYRAEFGVSTDFNGENVAYTSMVGGSDQSDAAAEAVAEEFAVMWWHSPGHRANMLGKFKRIGVGMYKTSRGAWYATQIFQ
jgi:uncharacterized protein YkwD